MIAPFFLVGCDSLIQVDLLLSNVAKLGQQSGGEAMLPGVVRVEVGSKDSCNENSDKFKSVISSAFESVKSGECVEIETKTYYQATVEIGVKNHLSATTNSAVVSDLQIDYRGENPSLWVAIYKDGFEAMNNRLADLFSQRLDYHNLTYIVTLKNDLPETSPVRIHLRPGLYANDQPVASPSIVTLKSGNQLRLKIGDVLLDHLYNKGALDVLTFDFR